MDCEGLAWPSPLLQSALPTRLGGASTAAASRCVVMMAELVLMLPVGISSLSAGQPAGALGANAMLQPWGRKSAEVGEGAVELVEVDEVLLPLTDTKTATLIKLLDPRYGCGSRLRLVHPRWN